MKNNQDCFIHFSCTNVALRQKIPVLFNTESTHYISFPLAFHTHRSPGPVHIHFHSQTAWCSCNRVNITLSTTQRINTDSNPESIWWNGLALFVHWSHSIYFIKLPFLFCLLWANGSCVPMITVFLLIIDPYCCSTQPLIVAHPLSWGHLDVFITNLFSFSSFKDHNLIFIWHVRTKTQNCMTLMLVSTQYFPLLPSKLLTKFCHWNILIVPPPSKICLRSQRYN